MPREYFLDLSAVRVAPADRPYAEGIIVKAGGSLPFMLTRSWSGPAGNYLEQWSLRLPNGEVIHRSAQKAMFIRGIQSVSSFTDTITEPIALEAGTYRLVFVVEGRFMGAADVEVSALSEAAA